MVLILLYQIFSVFQCSKMSFVLFGTVSQCCDTTSILDGFIFKTAERKSASTPGEPKPGQSWSPFPSFAYRVSYRSPLKPGPAGEHVRSVLNFLESFQAFALGRLWTKSWVALRQGWVENPVSRDSREYKPQRSRGLWKAWSNYGRSVEFWYFQAFKWTQKRTMTPMPTEIDENMFFTPWH